MVDADVIWLEVNANYNLKIYFINPGDEIFAPLNVWPISPHEQRLSNKNEYTQIRLTKKSKVSKKDECEDTPKYAYGGNKQIVLLLKGISEI
jgi:hypothetical protein